VNWTARLREWPARPLRIPYREEAYDGLPIDTSVLGRLANREEIIDLWTYVERPAAGQYQLAIELDIPAGRHRLEWEAKRWAGKIRSNTLEITLGK
jgi:hypothetical protein